MKAVTAAMMTTKLRTTAPVLIPAVYDLLYMANAGCSGLLALKGGSSPTSLPEVTLVAYCMMQETLEAGHHQRMYYC